MSEVVHEAVHTVFNTPPSSFSEALIYGVPSLDRPFGVALWPLFRFAVNAAFGYNIETFQYVYNSSTPLSVAPHVLVAIVGYYVVIFGGRFVLQNVRPIRLSFLFKVHNLILTLLSGFLLLLLLEQEIPVIFRHGVFYSICNDAAWTQKTELVYYLNYLTKYYELIDTVFMVLRKRPLTFLHTYHHGATALLCFSQLNGRTAVSYVPIALNLAVHVVMYFYYFLAACGIRPWWKTWVTRFQIIQFIIDLGFVYFATYTHFASKFNVPLPHMGRCTGEEAAAIDGCLILSSYLVLFVSFYIKSYIVPAAAKKAVATERRKSVSAAEKSAPEPVAETSTATPATKTAPKKRATRSRKA